jgi:hypothetical protein
MIYIGLDMSIRGFRHIDPAEMDNDDANNEELRQRVEIS